MSNVRVRFAPSPTGPLHIGGVRTALFNYLFAKKNHGTFILRIEDTDQKRYVAEAENYIKEALEWSGMIPDEGPGYGGKYGPYKQSERRELYHKHIQTLIAKGKAYYAFDTPEELDALRQSAERNGDTFTYNYLNRSNLKNSINLSKSEVEDLLEKETPYVIRFKIPAGQNIQFTDMVRGKLSIDTSTLDDKVLMKNDGLPTYHLANIVDDHEMAITHVIRGEEWLPSLALHQLMYEAFDWTPPQFAHLPLILKPVGKGKLSKRDGDKHGFPVFPIEWSTQEGVSRGYREDGYLPEAFVNMLALLGWNPGTEQEIFSLNELIEAFDINKVSKSGARFNPDKAVWFNHQYIQQIKIEDLVQKFQEILSSKDIPVNTAYDSQVVELMRERANFVEDIWEQGKFFYQAPTDYNEKNYKKVWKEDTKDILHKFITEEIQEYNADNIHQAIKEFVKKEEIGFGKIMMPLRLALVGALQGPDIPVLMEMLGKEEVSKRVNHLIAHNA